MAVTDLQLADGDRPVPRPWIGGEAGCRGTGGRYWESARGKPHESEAPRPGAGRLQDWPVHTVRRASHLLGQALRIGSRKNRVPLAEKRVLYALSSL